MNIVVIVSGGLAEVFQATALMRTLEEGLPGARMTIAGPPPLARVAGGLPGAAEILPLAALGDRVSAAAWMAGWMALRRRRLDVAVLCTTRAPARLLAHLAGIPRRVGPGGGPGSLLLSDRVAPRAGENDVVTWLRLAGALGIERTIASPRFVPDAAAGHAGEARLFGSGFEDGRILVALAPGAGLPDGGAAPAVFWESSRYAHLANQLAQRHGAAVVLLGTSGDRATVDEVLLDLDAPVLDLCGELCIGETAAVLARCDLLVTAESPLLHLAAAVGTPTVGLYGPGDGRRRGPCGPDHRVIQALDGTAGGERAVPSLDRIRVEDVLAGIEATL